METLFQREFDDKVGYVSVVRREGGDVYINLAIKNDDWYEFSPAQAEKMVTALTAAIRVAAYKDAELKGVSLEAEVYAELFEEADEHRKGDIAMLFASVFSLHRHEADQHLIPIVEAMKAFVEENLGQPHLVAPVKSTIKSLLSLSGFDPNSRIYNWALQLMRARKDYAVHFMECSIAVLAQFAR
jgi:hypothetical protein